MGGGVFVNDKGYYTNILNIVSSTIAGNTADSGSQVYTGGKNTLRVANSIIVANGDAAPIADKTETTGYTFQGNNLVGPVAEGYNATESDNIGADNTYAAVFGTNTLAENGTLTPVKFKNGMAPDAIASIVAAENWNFTVDTAVDQLGNERTATTSNGALAIIDTNTGVDQITVSDNNDDESWYNLQGVRFNERPTHKGIYIHKGKKVMVL